MNPFLTANLHADRELRAEIHKQELKLIQDQLQTALPLLKSAYDIGEKAGLKESNYELLQALGDALTACTDALERIDDAPDEIHDVALNHLPPITGIAQPPESASNNDTTRTDLDGSTTLDLLEEAYKPEAQEIKEWREAGYPGLRKPPSFA